MVKPLCSCTVCQVVTPRDVGFSWSKIPKQLDLTSRPSAKYAYKRYLKNNFFEAQKSNGRPPKLSKKIRKKVSYRCFQRSRKPHWSALEWLITLSLDTIQFPEAQLDEFSKMWHFSGKAAKKSVWRRIASVFVQTGSSICSRSRFLSGRMLFLLSKQGWASPATELSEFFEEMVRDFLKKNIKFEFGQTIT